MKTHSEEKSNKCNQYNFASSQAGDFRRHLKTHFGEKSNIYNQCDFASTQAGNLGRNLKTHSGKSQINATNVIMHPLSLLVTKFVTEIFDQIGENSGEV